MTRHQARPVAVAARQRIGVDPVLAVVGRERSAGGSVQATAGVVGAGKGAVLGPQAVLLVVTHHAHDIEAVFFQVAITPAGIDVVAAATPAGIRAFTAQRQRTVGHRFFGDEVDHAANGVGAVQCRGAVAQHFDAVDSGERDGVQVNRGTVDGVVA